jgi:hypothetical protein
MTTITRYRGRTSLVAALALAILVQRGRAHTATTPTVIPITERTAGLTDGQWGAACWKYLFSMPVHDPNDLSNYLNPLLDETGADCISRRRSHDEST